MNYMVSNSKRGSITIEVSIVFTVLLILITMYITSMNIQKTDLYMQAAIEQTSEEIAILAPFSRVTSYIMNGLLADEDLGESANEAMKSLKTMTGDFNDLTGLSLEELIVNGVLADRIKNDIAHEFAQRTDSKDFFAPQSIEVKLKLNPVNRVIEEYITYGVNTVFGVVYRSHYSVIPFYGKFFSSDSDVGSSNSDMDDESGINPWELGNFERGDYFSNQYGANLPGTFPVIDKFEDGCATSIVSLDLTKDTYSKASNIEKKIYDKLDQIEYFDGASVNINGENYTISESDIKDKQLIIVIPSNSPENRCRSLVDIVDNYQNQTFNVTIVKSGESA